MRNAKFAYTRTCVHVYRYMHETNIHACMFVRMLGCIRIHAHICAEHTLVRSNNCGDTPSFSFPMVMVEKKPSVPLNPGPSCGERTLLGCISLGGMSSAVTCATPTEPHILSPRFVTRALALKTGSRSLLTDLMVIAKLRSQRQCRTCCPTDIQRNARPATVGLRTSFGSAS